LDEKARRFALDDASRSDAQAKPRCARRANSNLRVHRSCCGAGTQRLVELGELIALLEMLPNGFVERPTMLPLAACRAGQHLVGNQGAAQPAPRSARTS